MMALKARGGAISIDFRLARMVGFAVAARGKLNEADPGALSGIGLNAKPDQRLGRKAHQELNAAMSRSYLCCWPQRIDAPGFGRMPMLVPRPTPN